MKSTVSIALEINAGLAEGPVWDAQRQRLWWVDISAQAINHFDPQTSQNRRFPLPSIVGAVALTHGDELVLAAHQGFTRFNPLNGDTAAPLTPPGHDDSQARFNDGKCDHAGRFLAGSVPLPGKAGSGALYSLGSDGEMKTLLRGVRLSNGMTWSPDGRVFYYIDTLSHTVAAFAYDIETGSMGTPRTAIAIPPAMGYPDGMTIDTEGMLWIALWGGWAITRWNPNTGMLLETHRLPVSQITSCTFGGPHLDTLYITSARVELSAEQLKREPLAGSLFSLQSGARGFEPCRYAG